MRTALQYAFAALLMVLSAQAAIPPPPVAAPIDIASRFEAKQQIPDETGRPGAATSVEQSLPDYESRASLEPDSARFFQRPPPRRFFFS